MLSRLNLFSKSKTELTLVASNQIVDILTTLLVTKLISVYLTKGEYGFYSLILSLLAFISIFPFNSLHSAIERYVIEYKNKNVYEKNYISLISIHFIFFILYLIALFFVAPFLSIQWKSILPLLIFFIISKIYKGLLITILNIERKRVLILIVRSIDMLIQLSIIVIFIFSQILSVKHILFSSILGSFVTILIILINERHLIRPKLLEFSAFTKVFNDILRFSFPLIFWGIFIWAQNMITRWFINFELNITDVANYSILSSLASLPAFTLIAIIAGFIVPIAYEKENETKGYIHSISNKTQKWHVLLWVIMFIIALVFKDFLIILFLDKKYTDVSWALPYLIFGSAIYCIGQISIYEIYYYKKPKLLLLSNVVPGLFTIITGQYMVREFGFNGAIYLHIIANLLSGIITLTTSRYFHKHITRYS